MYNMCGINGIISKEKDKDKLIKEMNKRIVHRGPDAEGIYVDDNVALGQRRLSIIDLAGGNQPIYNKDKSILIIYNGEVYNYKELKEELKRLDLLCLFPQIIAKLIDILQNEGFWVDCKKNNDIDIMWHTQGPVFGEEIAYL